MTAEQQAAVIAWVLADHNNEQAAWDKAYALLFPRPHHN